MENNEFYIGWQAEAPTGISRHVKKFVLALCLIVPLIGISLVLNQSGFATSTFEFGEPSEIAGILQMEPAPFLQVYRGKDTEGQPVYQNILLVGAGKHGAKEMLEAAGKQQGHSLDHKMVKLKGYLIYHDGRTLMEVEEMMDVVEQETPLAAASGPVQIGSGAVMGEITDPKCLFGVMKPGFGKPHRSCAARCIAGGIPPVLKTFSTDGQVQYYLLAGAKGEPVNQEILPYVAEQVLICGSIYKVGDWLVLYKDDSKQISRVPEEWKKEVPWCR